MSGCLSLISVIVQGPILGMPDAIPDPPLLAMVIDVVLLVVFLFVANVCYTGGWIVEIVVAKISSRRVDRFGTAAFKIGVIFSVVVALFPGVLFASETAVLLIARLCA